MRRSSKFLAGGALTVALIGGGAVAVTAGTFDDDDDDNEVPITGEAFDRASAVVLEQYPGARVTDTEVGDEEGYYEVEVTLEGGNQIDVHLDEDFNILGTENDGPDDNEDGDDDE